MTKTVILGPEYDEALQAAVMAALTALGGVMTVDDWGVGGSQELSTRVFRVDGQEVTVEAETYIGLSLSGPDALVDRVAATLPTATG